MADHIKSTSDGRYRVVVRRDPEDARFWLADVDGVDGAHTSSRSLATLDRYVREVIVLADDLPDGAEGRLALEWHYRTGDPEVDAATEQLRQRRAELESANRDLAEHTGQLARRLVTAAGFSIREAAALLSVSPARVDQLIQQPKKRARKAA
jgi:DNA-directed RNA polymerase specialized sigma24 family protein